METEVWDYAPTGIGGTERGRRVEIKLNDEEFNWLLYVLGFATHASMQADDKPLATQCIRVANAVNRLNPRWMPYETEGDTPARTVKVQVFGRRREVIHLTEPLLVRPGEKQNTIITGTGLEHWFRPDGIYDGWGMDVSRANLSPREAEQFLAEVEKGREFPEGA